MLLNDPDQILRFKPHSRSIVIRMDADQAGAFFESFVDIEYNLLLGIVEQTEWRYRTGNQAENIRQLILLHKSQRFCTISFPEFFQINTLIAFNGNQIITPALIIQNIIQTSKYLTAFPVAIAYSISDLVLDHVFPLRFGEWAAFTDALIVLS